MAEVGDDKPSYYSCKERRKLNHSRKRAEDLLRVVYDMMRTGNVEEMGAAMDEAEKSGMSHIIMRVPYLSPEEQAIYHTNFKKSCPGKLDQIFTDEYQKLSTLEKLKTDYKDIPAAYQPAAFSYIIYGDKIIW